MPRSLRRKSSLMDLSKLARRHSAHPYNLRSRNRCTNYNETHLSHSGMSEPRQRRQTLSKLQNILPQSDTNSRYLHLNSAEVPCSSNSLEQNRTNLSDRLLPETTTLYVNEDFGKSTESSSLGVTEDEEDTEAEDAEVEDAEVEDVEAEDAEADDADAEDSQSANTSEVEANPSNSSGGADGFSDTSYRRNYSASAYDYQELVGHPNTLHVGRSASQSAARTELDLAENLRDFDALATGDGGHNDPNVLEFSVTILAENENYF